MEDYIYFQSAAVNVSFPLPIFKGEEEAINYIVRRIERIPKLWQGKVKCITPSNKDLKWSVVKRGIKEASKKVTVV